MNTTCIAVVAAAMSASLILHAGCAQGAEKATPAGTNIQMTDPPTKEMEAFVATARDAFAKAPAGQLLSREELTRPDAMGRDWKLYSSEEYGEAKDGIRELLYVAQKPLLDLVEKDEIVLNLKVFPSAGAAREWALERALSGAAPTEWKINLAKTYFCKAGSPGDFCFGPHLFVRGNVVVGYGSDIVPVVSERVDSSLQNLIPQNKPANNRLQAIGAKARLQPEP